MTRQLKDGIYPVKPTIRNPLANYAIIKTFPNGEVKKRFMETIEDCHDQLEEWNQELGLKVSTKGIHREKVNHYSLFNVKTGKLEFAGLAKEVAVKFGCSPVSVCNAANCERLFQGKYMVHKNESTAV